MARSDWSIVVDDETYDIFINARPGVSAKIYYRGNLIGQLSLKAEDNPLKRKGHNRVDLLVEDIYASALMHDFEAKSEAEASLALIVQGLEKIKDMAEAMQSAVEPTKEL